MNQATPTEEGRGIDGQPALRAAFGLAKGLIAMALLYWATYGAWPAILVGAGSVQTSATLMLDQAGATLPAHAELQLPGVGPVRVACSAGAAAGSISCTTTARRESGLLIYEVVEQAFGWRLMPAVRDMRITTAFSAWPLLNEVLQWLIPCLLLTWLAAWPTRTDFRRGARALKASPWLAVTPVLLFAAVLSWALATGGGLRPSTLGAFAVIPVLLGPLQEELLYRGAAYRYMTHLRVPVAAHAIAITAAFVLLHAPRLETHPVMALWTTLAGLGLFWIRHRFQSLALCIALHAMYNALAIHVVASR